MYNEKFSFENISKDNPFIILDGLKNPYQLEEKDTGSRESTKELSAIYYVDSKLYFDENIALSILLRENIVFVNDHWWMKEEIKKLNASSGEPWPKEACETFSLNVNCNDTFAYACADAEECFYHDLETLYAHHIVDSIHGIDIWCMKKRNALPLLPICNAITKAGLWDITKLGLK